MVSYCFEKGSGSYLEMFQEKRLFVVRVVLMENIIEQSPLAKWMLGLRKENEEEKKKRESEGL